MRRAGVAVGIASVALAGAAALGAQLVPGGANAATTDTNGSSISAIKKRGELRVCTFMGYKPMSYRDKSGNPAGFDVDLGKAMASSLGVKYSLQDVAFENLIAGVQSGRCDLILSSMTPKASRAESVLFARLYVPFVMALIVRKGETRSSITQWNSPKTKMCIQIGSFSEYTQQRYFPKATVHKLNDMVSCALEVQTGKADAAPFDNIASHDYAKTHTQVKVIMDNGQLGSVSAAPAVALGNDELKEWIDTFVGEYIQNGSYETLFKKDLGFTPNINLLELQR